MARKLQPASAGLAFGGVASVSLLPASEIERRDRDKLVGRWVSGVVWSIVVAVILIAAAFGYNWYAQQQLVSQQAQTNSLITQIASLSNVSTTLAAQDELQSFRAEAMGADFAWTPLFAEVRATLPSGVTVSGFELATGAPPSQGAKPDEAIGLTGTLTFSSPNTVDIASLTRGLRGITGVTNADSQEVAQGTVNAGGYTYTVNITFDQSIYSGQYEKKAAQ